MFVKFIERYKFVIVIFFGILIGTVYANISVKFNTSYANVLNSSYLALYNDVTVDSFKLWQYVCKTRLRDFALLCILGMTAVSKPAFLLYLIYIGISVGTLISYAVMNFHFGGVVVYLITVFPQCILYIVTIYIILRLMYDKKKNIKNLWLAVIIAVIILLFGTYAEAYVNPWIIKNIFILIN